MSDNFILDLILLGWAAKLFGEKHKASNPEVEAGQSRGVGRETK